MLILRVISVFGLIAASQASSNHRLDPLSDEFIQLINSKQKLWTAARNFHISTPQSYLNSLAGTLEDDFEHIPVVTYKNYVDIEVPRYFDARFAWPYCPSLYDVRDQGSCGSCWAVAAASAMTDRFCIKNEGREHFYFSAYDILSCCDFCSLGCHVGGVLSKAWMYYYKLGVVSGGHYNSYQGCKPYEFPHCLHADVSRGPIFESEYGAPLCFGIRGTPRCEKTCIDSYRGNYTNDKRRNWQGTYNPIGMSAIQKDIIANGPVTTYFELYEDFYSYKCGIYRYTAGQSKGYHSVKLIGWGTKDGVNYWIGTNTWNIIWGEQGFFRMIRGTDHCGIESHALVG